MAFLRDAIRRSFLAPRLRVWRDAWRLRKWTSFDEKAACFYRSIIRKGDLCFDIGANFGTRTKVFRHLGASVVAVEPQDSCVAILRASHFCDTKVKVVAAACGERRARADIMLCESTVLSSMSSEWIAFMSGTKRFHGTEWATVQSCEVTTLDALIQTYGLPAFIKIDVEGYELQVLEGLSRPVRHLSFEFVAERTETTRRCIDRLVDLGFSEFKCSMEESLSLMPTQWITADSLLRLISMLGPTVFGDVYARLEPGSSG